MTNENTTKTGEVAEIKTGAKKVAPVAKKQGAKKVAPVAPAKGKGKLSINMHANGATFSDERPGVVAMIVTYCVSATKEKPVSKRELLALIVKKFGDRDPAKLKATVTGQLPSQLKGEKGIMMMPVADSDGNPTGHYYFDAKKTDEKRKEQGRPPLSEARQFAKPE